MDLYRRNMYDFESDSSLEEDTCKGMGTDSDSLDDTTISVENATQQVNQVLQSTNPTIDGHRCGIYNGPPRPSLACSRGFGPVRLPQTSSFNPSKLCQPPRRPPPVSFNYIPHLSTEFPHPSPELCPPPTSSVPPPPHTCSRKVFRSESCDNLLFPAELVESSVTPMTGPVRPCLDVSQSASSFDISLHSMSVIYDKPYIALGRKLLKAAEVGRSELIRQLLDAGADPNFTFGSEWTPLHKAARKGHAEVVSVLLLRGANPHLRTSSGFTALHIAAYNDYCGQCVTLLIDAGSDVGSINLSGRTPLHYAAEGGNMVAVRKLLAAGANKYATNHAGQTAVDIASSDYVRRLLR